MDWLRDLFDRHGGTVLGVLLGLLCIIVMIAVLDGRRDKQRRRAPKE